jgi:hypothetical protein
VPSITEIPEKKENVHVGIQIGYDKKVKLPFLRLPWTNRRNLLASNGKL